MFAELEYAVPDPFAAVFHPLKVPPVIENELAVNAVFEL